MSFTNKLCNPAESPLLFASTQIELKKQLSPYIGETKNYLLLVDSNTLVYCLPVLKHLFPFIPDEQVISLDAGEENKDVARLLSLWRHLQDRNAGHDSTLVNLGGGMITDIGGFAASTFKRGIPFVHVPTSLIGMADAAIGGKTAINLGEVKNQAGTFARPEAVVVHPGFLHTLPWEELLSGYAEIIKTALAGDSRLFEEIFDINPNSESPEEFLQEHVGRLAEQAAGIKRSIAARDPYDRNERQGLNFGHTIGHAMEAFSLRSGMHLPHGYAIATGMICETWLSTRFLSLPHDEAERIVSLLTAIYPYIPFQKKDIPKLIVLMRHDKKNRKGGIRMSLLQSPGKCAFGIPVEEALIAEILLQYIHLR